MHATRGPQSRTGSPDARLRPLSPHARPLPRLNDHLFFQRLENDGQEWLSSESDIWEPRARFRARAGAAAASAASPARSKAALPAAAQGLPRGEWRSQVFCQKHQLMEAVARQEFLGPGAPTCVTGR